jgi:hypothetical protein
MFEGQKNLTMRDVSVLLIAALIVSLATLAIWSCTADSSESAGSASTDPGASSSTAAPAYGASIVAGPASTPAITPPASEPFDGRPVRSYPPDTTNYARPAGPGERTP